VVIAMKEERRCVMESNISWHFLYALAPHPRRI
jgi:hypothetical protein